MPNGSVGKSEAGEAEHHGQPYDPVKENGEIFAGWSRPDLAVVITGRQDGYLEPCGCAGIERMKGGLNRRHALFQYLRSTRGWTVAGLDVGGLVKGFGPQADLKFQTTVNAMQTMRYDAIALGQNELQFGLDVLFAGFGDESPFISTNAALLGFDSGCTAPTRIVDRGGWKLGVAAVLGQKWQKQISDKDVKLADPAEKLAEVVPALRRQCDLLILLAHATAEETRELVGQFPQFDVVVTADGPPEPPPDPTVADVSNAMWIEVGQQGMYAIVLGLYGESDAPAAGGSEHVVLTQARPGDGSADQPALRIRYQLVPLDSRFPRSTDMTRLMAGYQEQLKEKWLDGLEVPTVPLPRKELLGGFVGSKECQSCHEESYDVWKKSGHAKAWDTLLEQVPPRNFDPECASCHVIGWHPQDHAPYETGFQSEKQTPQLIDVGCESCHGPGEKHVEAEMGSDVALQEALRKAVVITIEESQQAVSRAASDQQPCMNCHDLENSPDFNFETYWPKIEHREL